MSEPIKIELSDDVAINSALIDYCIKAYYKDFKRFEKLKKYYLNENDILNRFFEDTSLPNNKLIHSFPKYISNIATAYFMGKGVKHETADETYKDRLDEILSDNYTDTQDFEEAKEMSITGISYELLYINPDGKLKSKFFKADEVIPVYSSSIGSFLTMVLRFYTENTISGDYVNYVDVYTKSEVITFRDGVEINRIQHLMGDVPVIIRRNNSERKGDFEDIKSLIDAYDRSQSDTLNDLDYFTDAYLVLSGVEEIVEEDENPENAISQRSTTCMKQRRTLTFPDATGKAEFLIKNINDTATENFKNRVYKDIFFLSQVPNLTDENFSGNLSGVAMKYKLFGLEELASEKEKYWKSAERKKLKLITQYINTKFGTAYDWQTVDVSFDRSQIANLLETSEIMNNLRDLLSKETIIGMYPDVENAKEELQRLVDEKKLDETDGTPPEGVY